MRLMTLVKGMCDAGMNEHIYRGISDEDREIQRAARQAQDARTGKVRRTMPRKHKDDNLPLTNPRLKDRYLKKGRILYYKNKNSGEICEGVVLEVTQYEIVFKFGERVRRVPIGFINDRLFYTRIEAQRFGRSK